MKSRGILSESRKSNLPNIQVSPAGVKHTIQTAAMPETPVPSIDSSGLAEEAVPSVTTSADTVDLIMLPMYLSSPLGTILESIHDPHCRFVSLHDLIEAYSVLSARIRAQSRVIVQARHLLPALAIPPEQASLLARAVARDMRCALIDPSHSVRRTPPSAESFLPDTPMTDHEIQFSRDLAVLCHHALRFLSDVFTFQPLYSLFPERDIQDLFNDLLKIALVTSMPTPHANKTWSLVFWTIQVQNLPSAFLAAKKIEIVTALKQSICGAKGLQAKLDGFKAIHNLLKRHSRQFISPLLELLPLVLGNLTSESIEYRLQASHALGGFVLAKMNMLSLDDYPHERVVRTLRSFVKEQSLKQHSSQGLHLPGLVVDALSIIDSPRTKGPSWAVVVLASMVVLSDASIFFHPRTIKFAMDSLRHASRHKVREICTAHAAVWRALIWAFSRLSRELTVQRRNDSGKRDDPGGIREKVFKTTAQESKDGIGIALITLLLGPSKVEASTDVSRALTIIKKMLSGRYADIQQGILLLNRIVGAMGNPFATSANDDEWHANIDPSRLLFDGTFTDSTLDNLEKAVSSLGDVKIDRVRQISENELFDHWDDLIAIWIEGVEKFLQDQSLTLSGELLHSWQSLLLVQAHLTQGDSHLTASSAFARRVASIVARFLVQLEDPKVQLIYVQFVQKLWAVMKNVFSSAWLSPPAEIILAAVLKRNFALADEELRAAWSHLCADLISVGIPTLLHVVQTRSRSTEGLRVTRQLWTVLARTFQAPDDYVHWDDVICFLAIPLKAWVMSGSELKAWDSTLGKAISMARAVGIQSSAVIGRMFKRIDGEITRLISFPKAVVTLLNHVDVSDVNALPLDLFSVVDTVLVSTYPPSPESLAPCLDIIRLIGQVISAIPLSMLTELLTTLGESLQLWIGDKEEVMLESEFNSVVNDVYCRALDCLRGLELSLERLVSISPFLATAFVRVPHPAIGPVAFESFWRGTYHGLRQYMPFYPDCLKACLMGIADVCGGSLGEGLSMGTDTQITQMATVPDSQSLHYEEVQESEEDVSRHLLADTSMIVGATFPGELASKQHPIPTPAQDSSLETIQRIQHHHDYGNLKEYNSHLDDGPSRNKISVHQEDVQISGPSSRLESSRVREGWAHEEMTSWESSSACPSNSRDQIILSESPHDERKRPFDPSADRQSVKRRKTSPRDIRSPQSTSGWQSTGSFGSVSGVCFSDDPRTRSPALLSEDYNTWEAGISGEEIQDLRRKSIESDIETDTDDWPGLNAEPELLKALHATTSLNPLVGSSAVPKANPVPNGSRVFSPSHS